MSEPGERIRRLLSLRIPPSRQPYSVRDPILYALGLGLGGDPVEPRQLRFTYERELQVLPTFGVVLAHPGFWARDLPCGLDWVRIVHAEQGLVLQRPLPSQAEVIGQSRIVDVIDKGEGKGALVYYERRIIDADTAECYCISTQTLFCRGDGGIAGPGAQLRQPPPPHQVPDRTPDWVYEHQSLPQMALLYRLSGDMNPLHADPDIARKAGFERPILQGLASFGIAGWAVLSSVCEGEPARLSEISARFTAPVYPGEMLAVDIWRDGGTVSFNLRVPARGVMAIQNGRAVLRS